MAAAGCCSLTKPCPTTVEISIDRWILHHTFTLHLIFPCETPNTTSFVARAEVHDVHVSPRMLTEDGRSRCAVLVWSALVCLDLETVNVTQQSTRPVHLVSSDSQLHTTNSSTPSRATPQCSPDSTQQVHRQPACMV